jgi:hypothetical protein
MGLDLHQTITQIDALARRLGGLRHDRAGRLRQAVARLQAASGSEVNTRAEAATGRFAFLPAAFTGGAVGSYRPSKLPDHFCVLASDGSHIDVDRHLPVRCYLVNIGGCQLVYGSNPDALLFSQPRLYASEEELYIHDPDSEVRAQPVEGVLLGLVRTVEEVRALAEMAQRAPEGLPTLALLDGSLILWELGGEQPPGGRYPPFVRQRLLHEGLLLALDRLRWEAGRRPLAVAAYISLPNSTEVANALRLALCPYDVADCNQHCRRVRPGSRPCDTVHGLVDRELFATTLAPGERSGLFATRSSVVREYGPHAVRFFYLNVGEEVARVEVPAWVAEDDALLSLAHALALDQARRGDGYPVAIQEAHEQAAITGADREEFRRLVEEALGWQQLPVFTSAKRTSKTRRTV